jgi:hypothetical protein
VTFYQRPTSQALVPPTPVFGTLIFPVFPFFFHHVTMPPLCWHFVPKVGPKTSQGAQRAKKEPKSSLLGAQSVTFGCHSDESCPMQKHQYLFRFSHIIRVRAPPFSHSKSTRERKVHQKRSFSLFYAHFWRQSDAQGRPKAGPREPKGPKRSPKASPGTPKNHQKIDLGPHLGTQGSPGGSRGTPGRENDTKID